jgi:Na+/alanine symporter
MLYIGGYVMKNDPVAAAAAGNSARSAAGYVAMVAVYLNAFIICATWQGISWTGTYHSTCLHLIPDIYLTSPHSCL